MPPPPAAAAAGGLAAHIAAQKRLRQQQQEEVSSTLAVRVCDGASITALSQDALAALLNAIQATRQEAIVDALGCAVTDPSNCPSVVYRVPVLVPNPSGRCPPVFATSVECLLHRSGEPRYPERPQRLSHALRTLADASLLEWPPSEDGAPLKEPRSCASEMPPLHVLARERPATWEEVQPAHPTVGYRQLCSLAAGSTSASCFPDVPQSNDLYLSNDSTTARSSLTAAGACIDASLELLARHEPATPTTTESLPQSGFCAVRPPGHHCGSDAPTAFCVINNACVAAAAVARRLVAEGGEYANRRPRIAIVDWDVHHGDGTQQIVDRWNRDPEASRVEVLFLSLHRYDGGKYFPRTGHPTSCGNNGRCINIAFDTKRKSSAEQVIADATFDTVSSLVLAPLLGKSGFAPDFIFVSAGFDAAEGDPLGGMAVMNGFQRMFHHIRRAAAHSRGVVAILEGGYDVEAVAQGVLRCVEAMRCDTALPPLPPPSWVTSVGTSTSDADLLKLDSANRVWTLRAIQRAVLPCREAAAHDAAFARVLDHVLNSVVAQLAAYHATPSEVHASSAD